MSETRYVEEYRDGVLINRIPHEVSDEQLGREADEKVLANILAMADTDIKVPQIGKVLKALVRLRR